jgi:hypothetical protein
MFRRLRHDEQPSEELDEAVEPPPGPAPGYRMSADVQVRAVELEQELRRARQQLRAVERELFAARRKLRVRNATMKARDALSRGGLGAFLGASAGLALHWSDVTQSPAVPAGLTIVAFLFGALLGLRWDPPDDDFPAPPPTRLSC